MKIQITLTFECPICEGEGELVEFSEPELGTYSNPCGACDSTGRVGIRWSASHWFWNTVPVEFVEWYYDLVIKEKA